MFGKPSHPAAGVHAGPPGTLVEKLNSTWHERANQVFMGIVLAHWAEHLAQAWQVFVLHWPRPRAGGFLGLFFPWLVTSESLHYFYAIVMLAGLWILRTGFVGRARHWWLAAMAIQFWHHIEHLLLLGQAVAGRNFLGSPVPISVAQIWIPRVELHLFYNAIVFVPMVVAMYYHMLPNAVERSQHRCSCALKIPGRAAPQAA
jgi:hypothetical protein